MYVKDSKYIKNNKALFKALLGELLEKYEYASILVQDAYAKRYGVSKAGISANEDEMHCTRGFVVRVFDGDCFAEYSGNEISKDKIKVIVDSIGADLLSMGKSLSKSRYSVPDDEPTTFSKSTEYKVDPEELGDTAILEYLSKIHKTAMEYDERVLNYNAICSYEKYSKLFLSRNKDMEQNVMYAAGYGVVMTKKGEEVKTHMACFSNLGGMEVLDKMLDAVPEVCKVGIELLDSEPLTPGEYECICDPATTGMIVHEAFGHGVEMDMFVKDRAHAKNCMGEYVASPLITMHDGNGVNEVATYFFDDEGTLQSDTIVIDKGVLVAGFSDLQSAKALGTVPTGNGRRESFERKAYTRMTNTYFEAGTDKVEDMIASVKYGLFLENPMSGMEDPKNWGIQCIVNMAREIRDGKFTGKIFSPIVLTGYVPDLLKSISMVSDEIKLSGTGHCGKGHKEWVKVSDGGPYIKAKIRLG